MASIQKYGKGWRAFIRRKGVSKTSTFATKREAQDWAAKEEAAILSGEKRAAVNRTFRDALDRYEREVTPTKRSNVEYYILNTMRRSALAGVLLSELDASHIAQYRDIRLETVKPGTVLREMALLSNVCTVAMKEWRWLRRNPCTDVRKPSAPLPRDKRVTQDEIDALKAACKYEECFPDTAISLSVHAFLFAIETAMRQGEIAALTWDNVDLDKRTAYLPMTKNGTARTVPLSSEAVRLLGMLPRDSAVCFPRSIEDSFRYVRNKAGIKDLHFHDSRHEAITRLAKKLDVLALARMVGHKRIQQLMTYYNESAEDIAKKLS